MWLLKSIFIRNFFSYAKATLPISENNVLVLMGKNGSGKSVWFEAFLFCMFGRTARSMPLDKVVNRVAGKNTLVKIKLKSRQGQTLTVQRFRMSGTKKNKLQVWLNGVEKSKQGSRATQYLLEKIIGIDFEAFQKTSMLSLEFIKTFATATTGERKEALSKILGIKSYDDYSEAARKRKLKVVAALDETLQRSEFLDDEITSAEERLTVLKAKTENFSKKQAQTVSDLNAEIEELRDEITELEARIEEATKKEQHDWSSDRQKIETERCIISNKNANIRKSINELKIEKGKAEERLQIEESNLEALVGLTGRNKCPVCKERVKPKRLKVHVRALEELILSYQEVVDSFEARISQKLDRRGKLENRNDFLCDKLESILEKEEKQQHRISVVNELSSQRKELHTRLTEKLSQLERAKKETCDAVALCKEIRKQIQIWRAKQEEIDTQARKHKRTLRYYDAIMYMFKTGLRQLLMENARRFLSRETNRTANRLFDGGINVEYTGFDFEMSNENGADNFGGSSMGEKRRLVLSQLIAFQQLARGRSSSKLSLLFFDEPFDILDRAGCEKTAELIWELGKGSSIVVATHNNEFISFFDKVTNITKIKNFSQLES